MIQFTPNTIRVLLVHLLAIVGLFFTDNIILVLISTYITTVILNSLGLNLTYHKLFAHKSFNSNKWFPIIGTIASMLTMRGTPIDFVLLHRLHHAFDHTDRDPLTTHRGWYYVYFGNILTRNWLILPNEKTQIAITNDIRKKYPWVKHITSRVDHVLFYITLILLFVVSYKVGLIFVLTNVLTYHLTGIANGFTHKGNNGAPMVDNFKWLARIFSCEFNHGQHHAYPARYDFSTKDAQDYSVFFIEKFLIDKTHSEECV